MTCSRPEGGAARAAVWLALALAAASVRAEPWTPLWTATFDGAYHHDDAAEALAVDAAGDVYVAGWTDRSDALAGTDARLAKYTAGGALLWSRTFDAVPGGEDFAFGVAVGADGSVYLAGSRSTTGGSLDAWLAKFDPDGGPLWSQTYDGPAGGEDVFWGVAVDRVSGEVYAAGSQEAPGTAGDAVLVKYPAAGGAPVWTRTLDAAAFWDEWFAVSAAPGGGVAVAGYVTTADPAVTLRAGPLARRKALLDGAIGALDTDISVRRYDAAGALLWAKVYNANPDPSKKGPDFARGVAVDDAGRVCAAGSVLEPDPRRAEVWARAWTADGTGVLWTMEPLGANVAPDKTDAAFAVGAGAGVFLISGFVARPDLSQDRNIRWWVVDQALGTLEGSGGDTSGYLQDDEANAAAVTSAGNPIVAGYETRGDLAQGRDWWITTYAGLGPPGTVALPADRVRAWPSPFDPARAVGGVLKIGPLPAGTTVRLWTAAGLLVRELTAGPGAVALWDGTNAAGGPAASGVYAWTARPAGGPSVRGLIALVR